MNRFVSHLNFNYIEQRFFSYVKYSDNCWEWDGYKEHYGHGAFYIGKKCVKAHRWSYEYFIELIKTENFVCHHCDNPSCVNPFHLFQGTQLDNMRDCRQKVRHYWANKTHCKNGHEFNEKNTKITSYGARRCRPCEKIYQREWKRKKAALERES